jgi:hypothetical protein
MSLQPHPASGQITRGIARCLPSAIALAGKIFRFSAPDFSAQETAAEELLKLGERV